MQHSFATSWQFLLCFSKQELQPRKSWTENDKENDGGGGDGRRQSPWLKHSNRDLGSRAGNFSILKVWLSFPMEECEFSIIVTFLT